MALPDRADTLPEGLEPGCLDACLALIQLGPVRFLSKREVGLPQKTPFFCRDSVLFRETLEQAEDVGPFSQLRMGVRFRQNPELY